MADVYPEILTEMAISVTKSFLKGDGKIPLADLLAKELARVESSQKMSLTKTHMDTVCQMINRAVHKNLFKDNRFVEFDLVTPKAVRTAMTPKKEKAMAAMELPDLHSSGEKRVVSKEPKIEKTANLVWRDKLPGLRKRERRDAAEQVTAELGKVATLIDESLKSIPPEEIIALAVIVDTQRGGSLLTKTFGRPLEKTANLNKVAAYTGMAVEDDHPLVKAMTEFLDAVELYKNKADRAARAW